MISTSSPTLSSSTPWSAAHSDAEQPPAASPVLHPGLHPTLRPALDAPIQAAVLVALADLSRFMRRSRGRTSAELFADLNDLYLLIEDAITAAGGVVIKFMGDATLIVFPEELADAGIMALLELKSTVDRWLIANHLGDGLVVNAHVGEVTLGRMGRAGRLDVIGESVAIAATLGARSFGLSQQAFRRLSAEHRRQFRRYTPPIHYRPIETDT
jgi:class 3 adenylate cyclase